MQNKKSYEIAAEVIPSLRQLEWQKLEMYAFCHFGTNTFTGREWGDGTAPASIFNPKKLDARQWAREIKNAGMKAIILTCKHHDGFCLWQSDYTDYCMKNSPYKNGKGDIAKEVSDACREYGLKFGVYLSPWDRHEATYGTGEEYNTYFKNQLTELATKYGDIFCFWFDGACGEGKNGKKQVYDWESYFDLIRELQPNAVINICGPDVRWCGNEAGKSRESEWSVVPAFVGNQDYTAKHSQQEDTPEFAKNVDAKTQDLGSRAFIDGITNFIWYPAEVDVSIRPGWFYHKREDFKVKSLKKLMQIYWGSVGGNSSLLLNIPPNKQGLLAKADVRALRKFGNELRKEFPDNLMKDCVVTASSQIDYERNANNIITENSYWQCGENDEKPTIEITFNSSIVADKIVLKENIATGQQIESLEVFADSGNGYEKICSSTIIGAKRICRFKKQKLNKIKIVITSYRVKATLNKVELYCRK
ncbi:MAG: alpha-fucosidase [Ruminococcaceae bacterium]|nr:alpha-fucosidase [Oscillospiraceae bacterium]